MQNDATLVFTGERFHPEISGNIELEHMHRYIYALAYAEGKTILDIASGEGYGAALLASRAVFVTGVDIAEDAVAHAREKYHLPNL
ncbi:MAG: class I SAM-dependent methyltransferase, partial [Beijerinckiaceae bacterium]